MLARSVLEKNRKNEKAVQDRDEFTRNVFSYVVEMFNEDRKKSMPKVYDYVKLMKIR